MADVFGNDSAVDPRMDDVLHPAEVTILGVGNVILRDEGFGVRVAEYLDAHYDFPESVQVIDGGTLGIELTQYVTGTKKLLVIDSINGGQAPGTRFHFHNDDIMAHFQDKLSAHEVGIQDVLALLTVTGRKIPEVVVLGAQPYDLEAGVELSPEMKKLLPPHRAGGHRCAQGVGHRGERERSGPLARLRCRRRGMCPRRDEMRWR